MFVLLDVLFFANYFVESDCSCIFEGILFVLFDFQIFANYFVESDRSRIPEGISFILLDFWFFANHFFERDRSRIPKGISFVMLFLKLIYMNDTRTIKDFCYNSVKESRGVYKDIPETIHLPKN